MKAPPSNCLDCPLARPLYSVGVTGGNRLVGMRSPDPYWLALHLVHPDYLYPIVDEITTDRAKMPNYS